MIREACVDSLESAVRAAGLGADRIELCSNLHLDGLTPGETLVEQVCQAVSIPVMVMIRPEVDNFRVNDASLNRMIDSIELLSPMGIHGVVFGVLDEHGWPHIHQINRLVAASADLQCTFHKAIDATPDPVRAIEMLTTTGVHRVLTSGGEDTALKGAETINMMQRTAPEIAVIAAGKITSQNLDRHRELLNVHEFHGRNIVPL